MGRRRANVNWVEKGNAGRGVVYGEGKRELRQRLVGDVAWLPQAEERGGVVEHRRSAERGRGRGREGGKAGGEEARSKDRTAVIKERGRERKQLSCTATKQQSAARERREKII